MKCSVCGATLTDYESILRHAETKQFLDTCMKCIREIGNIPVIGRADMLTEDDVDTEEFIEYDEDSDIGYDDDYYKDIWDER